MVDNHIEFYDQHKISPVRLNLPNLDLSRYRVKFVFIS